jgi:hypothetical protein
MAIYLSDLIKEIFTEECKCCGYLFRKPRNSLANQELCSEMCRRIVTKRVGPEEIKRREDAHRANYWLMQSWRGDLL